MKHTKMLSAAIAACILTGSCITPNAAAAGSAPQEILYGDANQSGIVDISDAVLIARFYAEDWNARISDAGLVCADVNLDGYVDLDDTIWILQHLTHTRKTLGIAEILTESKYSAANLTDGVAAAAVTGKQADSTFIHSQLALTANLLRETARQEESGKNLLISPLSISQALAMTANGASGQTLSEMESVLGDDLTIDDLNAYYYDYTANLPDSKKGSLKLANSIWFRDEAARIQVPEAFLKTNADYYGADAFRAAFDESTLTDINNWVNYHTHEMIPTLLDEIDPWSVMYLINALAFEAEWTEPYETSQIHTGNFRLSDGSAIEVPMMYGSEYLYLEDEYATGFIKTYGSGEYSFAAILPKESEAVTVSDYIGMMDADSLQALLDSRRYEKVLTAMPKFSYAYDTSLAAPLMEMGMPTAFSGLADFSGLSAEGNVYISDVLHKTFITVDERGTKAGAVTAVIMNDGAALDPPKEVYLDRPFIFMILDERTQLPVFIGYVMDPSAQ